MMEKLFKLVKLRALAVLMLSIFSIISLHAGNILVSDTLHVGEPIEGKLLSVEDPEYATMFNEPNWSSSFEQSNVQNYVILYIDNLSNIYQPESYSVRVTLEITREVMGASEFETITNIEELEVNYERDGGSYKDKAIAVFDGGHLLNVEVKKVEGTAEIMNLGLIAGIRMNRFYNFNPEQAPIATHDNSEIESTGDLIVNWNTLPGAEEYDLEWTFVNNVSASGTRTDPFATSVEDDLFRLNSSRVTVTDTSYRIPLIYEQGFIVYRLRGIGTHSTNRSLYQFGSWTTDKIDGCCSVVGDFTYSGHKNYLAFEGHEKYKNWQYIANYAEEGKSKIAVSYYDGSLRNRQTVSKLKEENETIAGETIYDFEGREAVSVLPVPTGKEKLEYVPEFNVNEQGQSYSYHDFDKDADQCDVATGPLGNQDGAGEYYSPRTTAGGHQDYIPDAKGYPLSRTEFTPDNTGRIRRQGGVGPDHQLGSGHETKYFYGIPDQEELDRLFGAEAGENTHYKKNMVQDANGQVTVSYLDMQGNVIATAMAGNAPRDENGNYRLTRLDNRDSTLISSRLIKATSKKPDQNDFGPQERNGQELVYSKEVLVSEKRSDIYNYELTQEQYEVECTNDGQLQKLCFDCVLEVTFKVEDECGKQYFVDGPNGTGIYDTIVGSEVLAAIDRGETWSLEERTDLNILRFEDLDLGRTVDMEVKNYTVSKVLKVNQKALDYFTELYLSQECLIPFNVFADIEKSYIDTIGCNMSCDTCFARLGDFNQYDITVNPECDPCYTFDEYEAKYNECQSLCNVGDVTCEQALTAMISDVSPMGQYAKFLKDNGDFPAYVEPENYNETDTFRLSIFNPRARLPRKTTSSLQTNYEGSAWKNPVHYQYDDLSGSMGHYYDLNGERAKTQVYYNGTTFTPALDSRGEDEVFGTNQTLETGYYEISPQYLYRFSDFIAAWPPDGSWANSLLVYHPEFASLQICENLSASNNYDDLLVFADTASESYLPEMYSNPISVDPYFKPDQNPYYNSLEETFFRNDLNNYEKAPDGSWYSIWQMSYLITNCPNGDVQSDNSPCPETCLDNFNINNAPTNDEWITFKSLYRSLKQKRVARRMIHEMIKAKSYNACMSDDDFRFSDNRFLWYRRNSNRGFWNWYFFNREVYNFEQPCSVFNVDLFRNKKPRFVVNYNIIKGGATGGEVCYEVPNVEDDGFVDAETFEPSPTEITCQEEDRRVIEKTQSKAQAFYIDQCGECPIAYDLAQLFSGVAKALGTGGISNESPLQLSCYPEGIREFVPAIEDALGLANEIHYWQTLSTETVQVNGVDVLELKANIYTSNEAVEVILRMNTEYEVTDYYERENVFRTFVWSDINEFCCFNYLFAGQTLLSDQEMLDNIGRTFKAGASVPFTQTDNTTRDVKISIEGFTSKIILNECDVTNCEQKPFVNALIEGMSMLAYQENIPGEDPVSSQLVTSGIDIYPADFDDNSSTIRSNNAYLFDVFNREVLVESGVFGNDFERGEITKWHYEGIVVAGVLEMHLTPYVGSVAKNTLSLELSLPPQGANAIQRFSYLDANLEKDSNDQFVYDIDNTFLIHTLVETGGTAQYIDLNLISGVPLTDCKTSGYTKNQSN